MKSFFKTDACGYLLLLLNTVFCSANFAMGNDISGAISGFVCYKLLQVLPPR